MQVIRKGSSQNQKIKPPTRNKSAFILFSQDKRPQLTQELKLNSNLMMVKLGELWRGLNPEIKEDYERRAADDKERYLREMDEFTLKYPSAKIIHNKTKKNYVKKACSAYAVFLRETLDAVRQENPGLKMADLMKIFSKKWKELPADAKKIYEEKALKEQEAARSQLSEKDSNRKSKPKVQKRGRKPKVAQNHEETPSSITEQEFQEQETIYFEEDEAPLMKIVKLDSEPTCLGELDSIDKYLVSSTERNEECQLDSDFYSLMTSSLPIDDNLTIPNLEKSDTFMFAEAINTKPAYLTESKMFDLNTFDYQPRLSMTFSNFGISTNELPFLTLSGSVYRSRCSDKIEQTTRSRGSVFNQLLVDMLAPDQESVGLPSLVM